MTEQPEIQTAPKLLPMRFDMPITDAYEWIESGAKKPVSEFGKAVASILGRVWRGIYHLESVLKSDWSSERMIEVLVFGSLDSFDFDYLSSLVILCHDACIRVEVNPCNFHYLKLRFHPRKGRNGGMSQRHPTIDEAINSARRQRTVPGEWTIKVPTEPGWYWRQVADHGLPPRVVEIVRKQYGDFGLAHFQGDLVEDELFQWWPTPIPFPTHSTLPTGLLEENS